MTNDWQPIATAPLEIDVLLWDHVGGVWIGHRFRSDELDEWYPQDETTYDGAMSGCPPTHWMPLPDQPKK